MARGQVLQVKGTVVLQWPDGMRIAISPPSGRPDASAPEPPAPTPGRRGRKPSPATQTLIDAMAADAAKGTPRSSADYLAILQGAGHNGSPTSARLIINREAKRAFGRNLRRAPSPKPAKRAPGGRGPSPATAELRAKLMADKAGSGVRDAGHYIRWLVDQANIGIKKARPIVYRELRAVR
jgi:hypothetical protein